MKADPFNLYALIFLFILVYLSIYVFIFPFIKADTNQDYTITNVKKLCDESYSLLSENEYTIKKICSKYNKIYYSLHLALILDALFLLLIFSAEKKDEQSNLY